ncbi:MAG: 2-dehydropantoate 2-reductase [bacterium]|nr:2-dehydropantoate 2-reductase [bacterium]
MDAAEHFLKIAIYHCMGETVVAENAWPRFAVLGAGAVGGYYGGMLARAGAPVTLIGRPQHITAINQNGLFLDSSNFQERIPVAASTEVAAIKDAEIVLFCVKTLDTEAAARMLAPHLASNAVVMSFQNGVDNVARIRAVSGIDAIPTVVYVAAEMAGPGHVKHTGRGDIIIGEFSQREQSNQREGRDLKKLAALFERAGIPCVVSRNIEADLWTKLIINCTYNAISALGRVRYGRIVRLNETREVMKLVIAEAAAVARAEGVRFGNDDLIEIGLKLAEKMENTISSTAQDLARGKPTEIDALNGYVFHRGAELGVATPVNQTLHALVKLFEEGFELK